MITFHVTGSFKRTDKFLLGSKNLPLLWKTILNKYGRQGLEALKNLTPKDSGITADSWSYTISRNGIIFENSSRTKNSNIPPIAILLQYGHATGTGGYVTGVDFINPALRPIFDQIAIDCWQEVVKL